MSKLVKHQQPDSIQRYAYEPQSIDQGVKIARWIFDSGLCPSGIKCAEDVFLIMMAGREFGMSTMRSLRSFYVINGKVSLLADAMVALCQKSPVCEYFRCVKTNDEEAIYETLRVGHPTQTQLIFTLAQARRAGTRNLDKHPAAMLRARCSSALARMVFPDIIGGLYDPNEMPEESDVQPVQVPSRPAPPQPPPRRIIDVDKMAEEPQPEPEPEQQDILRTLPGVGPQRADDLREMGVRNLEDAAEWITGIDWVSTGWAHGQRMSWLEMLEIEPTHRDLLWQKLTRQHDAESRVNIVLEKLVFRGLFDKYDPPHTQAAVELDVVAIELYEGNAVDLTPWELATAAFELRDRKLGRG